MVDERVLPYKLHSEAQLRAHGVVFQHHPEEEYAPEELVPVQLPSHMLMKLTTRPNVVQVVNLFGRSQFVLMLQVLLYFLQTPAFADSHQMMENKKYKWDVVYFWY